MKKRLLATFFVLVMLVCTPGMIMADEINNIDSISTTDGEGSQNDIIASDENIIGDVTTDNGSIDTEGAVTQEENTVDPTVPVKPLPPEIVVKSTEYDSIVFEIGLDSISKKYKLFVGEDESEIKLFATINMLVLRGEKNATKKNPEIKFTDNFSYKLEYEITESDTLKFVLSELPIKKTFYITAQEQNIFNKKSKKSEAVRAITELSAPVNVFATMKDYGLTEITWDEVSGAEKYFVFRCDTYDGVFSKIGVTDTAKYTDDLNGEDHMYYYKIKAKRKKKKKKYYNSEDSDVVCTQYERKAPQNLCVAEVNEEGMKLTWNPVPGGHTYSVSRSEAENSGYRVIATLNDECSYTDSDMLSGVTYYYKVATVYNEEDGTTTSYLSTAVNYSTDSIILNTTTVFMSIEQQLKLSYVTEIQGVCQWFSADESIAIVDEEGVVTAVSEGVTQIAAEIDGVRSEATVTVKDCAMFGIDISKWQGDVNWDKLIQTGIQFVMLRAAYGTNKDIRFDSYYKNAQDKDIPVGVYCYSIAMPDENHSAEEAARIEAENLISILDGRKLQLPIALDFEDDKQIKLSAEERMSMIKAYKEVIEGAGYSFIVYANLNWLKNYIPDSVIKDNDIKIWIARYIDTKKGHGYEGSGAIDMWQYSKSGKLDGIKDSKGAYIEVDLDMSYVKYPKPSEEAIAENENEAGTLESNNEDTTEV